MPSRTAVVPKGTPMLSQRLITTLQDFARDMTSEYLATDKLDALMQVAVDEIGVDGCGAMLCDENGDLRFVSASDERTGLIEQFQLDTEEGPCVMAALTGEIIVTSDLRDGDDRFPLFARVAVEHGMFSVHSFPMTLEGHSFGALNLYSDDAGALSVDSQAAGVMFADMATTYLMGARRIDQATQMVAKLRAAMDRNAPIEQAKGYVAGVRHIDPADAFDLIRRYARSNRKRIDEVAANLVRGTMRISDLDPSEPS